MLGGLIRLQESFCVKPIQPQAVVPHDLAFGVGADAGQVEKRLEAVRERAVGMGIIDGHDDVVVADVVDDDAQQLLVHIGADEALALEVFAWQG